jgi:transcriptional regulator with XRE-family HTH domain
LQPKHRILRMTQEQGPGEIDALVRRRVRALRIARGWSLDQLAERCWFSASTLSRMETGHRRIGLDQLTAIARALGTSLDHLVAPEDDEDVVIRPIQDESRGRTTWVLSRDQGPRGVKVVKVRLTQPLRGGDDELKVHLGRDWFTVLSGTVLLVLGDRTIRVETGQAAEFSTMVPHAFGADGGPAEILTILDPDGERSHLHD